MQNATITSQFPRQYTNNYTYPYLSTSGDLAYWLVIEVMTEKNFWCVHVLSHTHENMSDNHVEKASSRRSPQMLHACKRFPYMYLTSVTCCVKDWSSPCWAGILSTFRGHHVCMKWPYMNLGDVTSKYNCCHKQPQDRLLDSDVYK